MQHLNVFKAIEIEPENTDALFNMGLTFEKMEKFSEAAECFENVLLLDENHRDSYYELGYCFDFLDRMQESVDAYEKHLNYSPGNYTPGTIRALY
ncbi:MAG: tetratricopeptide repeat protein [Ignavibacteria bacterium]